MKNIRNKILAEFENLDAFRYTNAEPRDFDRDTCEKIAEEALQYHCKGHQYSNVLKAQFVDLYGNGFVEICGYKHPYRSHDIYWRMEEVINDRTFHKPFLNKNSFLYNKNIFHTHHSQTFYSMENCIRYFKRKYLTDSDVWTRLRELQLEFPKVDNIMPVFANTVLMESLSWPKKTGEWLVYEKCGKKINFLCMYIHAQDKNDEHLFSLIKEELST